MTARCHRCGEYTKCRKILVYCGLTCRPEWSFNEWICQKCDISEKIIMDEKLDRASKEEEQIRLNWRKERDKILKQHEKRN
jgi:hypothetical protein